MCAKHKSKHKPLSDEAQHEFETMVVAHYDFVLRFLQSRGVQLADALDICQETICAAITAQATYDWDRPVLPWLISIAVRKNIDRRRKNREASIEAMGISISTDHSLC